jgi:hypothetical protein
LQDLRKRTFHASAFPSSKNGNGKHETGARPAKSTGGTSFWEHINSQTLQSDTSPNLLDQKKMQSYFAIDPE